VLRANGATRQPQRLGDRIVSDINDNQHHSRPSRYSWLVGVAVILGIAASVYWPEISTFARFPQLKQALGL
jgi:hypothetical protein